MHKLSFPVSLKLLHSSKIMTKCQSPVTSWPLNSWPLSRGNVSGGRAGCSRHPLEASQAHLLLDYIIIKAIESWWIKAHLKQNLLEIIFVCVLDYIVYSPNSYACTCVYSFVTPWTITLKAPLSMGFPNQEYWSGFLFPSPQIHMLKP